MKIPYFNTIFHFLLQEHCKVFSRNHQTIYKFLKLSLVHHQNLIFLENFLYIFIVFLLTFEKFYANYKSKLSTLFKINC